MNVKKEAVETNAGYVLIGSNPVHFSSDSCEVSPTRSRKICTCMESRARIIIWKKVTRMIHFFTTVPRNDLETANHHG